MAPKLRSRTRGVASAERQRKSGLSAPSTSLSTRAIVCKISYVDREKYFPTNERIPVGDAPVERPSVQPSTATRAIVCRISYIDRKKYFPTAPKDDERIPESVVEALEEESVASEQSESPVSVTEDTAKDADAPVKVEEVPLELLFAALTLADKEEVEEKDAEKNEKKERVPQLTQPSRDVTQITLLPPLSVEEEEFRCAICYDIMHRPVKLSCSHYFCRACAIDWMVVCENRANCSMCRTPTISMTDDVRFTRRVEKYLKLNPDRRRVEPVCTSDVIAEKLEMGARAMEKVAQLLMAANVALPPDC